MSTSITLLIGIDAGGTKTRLLAKRSDQPPISELLLPGLNLQRDGLAAAIQLLYSGIEQAVAQHESAHELNSLSICAGIAGAGGEKDRTALAASLEERIQKKGDYHCNLQVLTDAAIAFRAAHKERPGLLIITGTGSILWAKAHDGRMYRSGGWGYLLGDEGGGYRIGLAGLRALANMIDGGPNTALMDAFCERLQLCTPDALLEFVYHQKMPPQQAAPIVLDTAAHGDPVALQILTHQALAIAAQLKWLIQSAPAFPLNTVLIGGLSQHVFYRDLLTNTLQKQFPALSFSEPSCTPAEAALEMATLL